MLTLRPYQRAAIDAVFDFWSAGGGNGLLDLATGTGKSVVIAEICRRVLENWPDMRILMLAPSRELIAQNAAELIRLWQQAPVGINSASLGRRDKHSRILFATVNSIYRNPAAIGARDLIVVDEAHLLPKSGDGMYRALLSGLRELAPDLRILGLSATIYRMDSGLLHRGEEALFDSVVYTYGIKEGVRDGYLSPLISRPTRAKIDISSVHVRGGEFIASELEDASLANVREAVAEMVAMGEDRRAWLAFCAGIKHAEAVRDAVRDHGITCEMVTGDTPSSERAKIIESYRAGHIRCLSNVNVLSTGFNVPHVDLLAFMRATLSTGLYVQQAGRGTRLAEGKNDCLCLDYALNISRHGPVDAIQIEDKAPKVKPGTVMAKECPQCGGLIALAARSCPHCGYEYPAPEKPKHEARADAQAVIMASIEPPRWLDVTEVDYALHVKRDTGSRSLRVDYLCGLKTYSEWVPLESERGRGLAAKWWGRARGSMPLPETIEAALERQEELVWPEQIAVRPEGKFWRVISHKMPTREEVAA